MPLLTICSYPGCHSPVPRGDRYCERHKEQGEKRDAAIVAQAKKRRDARRRELKGTTAQRGYGARWQALRKRFILQHPYCERCLKEGRITPATDVDHIKPHRGCPRLLFDENNLQALCHECHSRKTATEDGGFGNVKVS
nr:MAG TPA: HNH endonuclease [Caudoviricetes sp.]DAZ83227.1 MAG TPA: HNH endonuclease [Caudoviricetes sp.]